MAKRKKSQGKREIRNDTDTKRVETPAEIQNVQPETLISKNIIKSKLADAMCILLSFVLPIAFYLISRCFFATLGKVVAVAIPGVTIISNLFRINYKKMAVDEHPLAFQCVACCLIGTLLAVGMLFSDFSADDIVADTLIIEEDQLDSNTQLVAEDIPESVLSEDPLVFVTDTPNTVATLKQDLLEITAENAFIPSQSVNDFYHVISSSLPKFSPSEITSLEEKINFRDILADQVQDLIASKAQVTDAEINGNPDFTNPTSEANKLEEEMKKSGYNMERVNTLIELREEALAVYKVRDLLQMLSNDYQRLGGLLKSSGQIELAYDAYMQAVAYRVEYISYLSSAEDKYHYSLYHLGNLFHSIGDLPHLDYSYRENAFYLSEAFYWLGSNYDYTTGDYCYLGIYYCAMTNHKLIAFYDFYDNETTDIHISEADKYYTSARQRTTSLRELSNIDDYLCQIYTYAEDYLNVYNSSDCLYTYDYYALSRAEIQSSIR